MRKWQVRYARSADAEKFTDIAIMTIKQLNHMKTLPWIKIFNCTEEPEEAETGLIYSDYENLILSWKFE